MNPSFKEVQEVFAKSSQHYQLLNTLMSAGLDRYWRQMCIETAGCKLDDRVLDLASGSAEMAVLAKSRCRQGQVIASDFSVSMMELGRNCIIDAGMGGKIPVMVASAEYIPLQDEYFDHVTIAFGWRNFQDKVKAAQEIFRVLKPGGKLTILELCVPPNSVVAAIYDALSEKVLPKLGELIGQNPESYQYLHRSIRQQPSVEAYGELLSQQGLTNFQNTYLSMGVVSIMQVSKP